MAVFDDKTQKLLGDVQNSIIREAGEGTQTMGIPFHVTLGSYPTSALYDVIQKIKDISRDTCEFQIQLTGYNSFASSVLYLEPQTTDELVSLRREFECDYANGFEWVPHATLFCGNADEMNMAVSAAPTLDFPIYATVTGIELGEFFPARKILKTDFKKQEEL